MVSQLHISSFQWTISRAQKQDIRTYHILLWSVLCLCEAHQHGHKIQSRIHIPNNIKFWTKLWLTEVFDDLTLPHVLLWEGKCRSPCAGGPPLWLRKTRTGMGRAWSVLDSVYCPLRWKLNRKLNLVEPTNPNAHHNLERMLRNDDNDCKRNILLRKNYAIPVKTARLQSARDSRHFHGALWWAVSLNTFVSHTGQTLVQGTPEVKVCKKFLWDTLAG